jgi:16S rRNA (cytosine967-C5)-methyltransferase
MLVACDIRDRRVDLLQRTVVMAGARNIRIVQADLLAGLPFRDAFDTVVVDAPCSGLGTLRRDPDIKWRRQDVDLPGLAAAQVRMLAHAAAVVRPGGRLVYATCSSEPEENEEVVARFLAAQSGFAAADAATAHPLLDAALIDTTGYLRTSPALGLECFFGAVLTRRVG